MGRRLKHRRNLIYTYEGPPPATPVLPPSFRIVRATPETIDACMREPELENRKRRYQRFVATGAIGFLALHGTEWAAAGWIAPPELDRFPPQIPDNFSEKHHWLFEAHTHEPFRGMGLHKALVVKRLEYLADGNEGVAEAIADVNPNNVASRRSYRRLGFVEAGIMDIWLLKLALPHLPRAPFGIWRKKARHPRTIAEEPEKK